MRNLIAFFRRFRIFLVFAVLQIVALSMYIQNSEFARLQTLSTAGAVNGRIMSVRHDITKHFQLEDANKMLAAENARLRAEIKESNYQLERNRIRIQDTTYDRQYEYIAATVLSNTYDKRNNYMTIDIGSNQGIKQGWGVISSKGVVGIVHAVGSTYAVVKTVLSKNINIDVSLKDDGAFGLLKWDGINPNICQVSGISNDISIKRWAKIITRGSSGIFPRGIPVGVIERRKSVEGKPLWDLQVNLAVDFRRVAHVYVVKNLKLKALRDIEKRIPEDKEEEEI
jgi:rod shape-determining protein MreC